MQNLTHIGGFIRHPQLYFAVFTHLAQIKQFHCQSIKLALKTLALLCAECDWGERPIFALLLPVVHLGQHSILLDLEATTSFPAGIQNRECCRILQPVRMQLFMIRKITR